MSERRIARAEDDVGADLDVELLLQRGADIDLGEDTEPLLGELLAGPLDRALIVERQGRAEAVAGVVRDHEISGDAGSRAGCGFRRRAFRNSPDRPAVQQNIA
jgi:hypothetical protein